jgi:putative ABC transport system substrate-binding protein
MMAEAQQSVRLPRVGILSDLASDDPEAQTRLTAFLQAMQQVGWTDGGNVQINVRWGAGNPERIRKHANELVGLAPDVILAATAVTVAALQSLTRTIPIVFVQVVDPVGAGYVESLSRPRTNATGFSLFEYGMSGKWLEFLKETIPTLERVAVFRDPAIVAGPAQLGAIQAIAPSRGVDLRAVDVRDPVEMERIIADFAKLPNGGMLVTASPVAVVQRNFIISLAARYKLPAIYSQRSFVIDGGLIAYGPDRTDQYRRAATYVDRILKGEKPGDLPVQAPTRYQLSINLKTAKILGVTVPPMLLTRADEVIE